MSVAYGCHVAATQLKPDVGTPELPAGRVRVRRDADGSITEVDEDSVQRVSPPGAGSGLRGVLGGTRPRVAVDVVLAERG